MSHNDPAFYFTSYRLSYYSSNSLKSDKEDTDFTRELKNLLSIIFYIMAQNAEEKEEVK